MNVDQCDRILIIGTTLATYSAFRYWLAPIILRQILLTGYRLLKHALELKKPVMLLNVGPTRADGLSGIEKIDMSSGAIIRDVVKEVLCVFNVPLYLPVADDHYQWCHCIG